MILGCALIISQTLLLPLAAVRPLILIQLRTREGSKANAIAKHYHSSSSINYNKVVMIISLLLTYDLPIDDPVLTSIHPFSPV